ncbi:MAG: hypothetical protein QNJ36_08955 [Calothrix sp. MO_167.B42]|nr:hypothetical protein [Calothrix sp. MO_167.B42]
MNNNGDFDLVVLTLYIIGITYTFNRMVDSIADQMQVEFDSKKTIAEQLKKQNLEDKLEISFGLKGMYPIDGPDTLYTLPISIKNKSGKSDESDEPESFAIYVDWDNSSIFGSDQRSRRVIRQSPDLIRDLAVPQIPSLIVPGNTLKELVTAEDVFKRDKETGTYSPGTPIINIPKEKKYKDFMARKLEFEFSLDLVLRTSKIAYGIAQGQNVPPVCIINCPFTIRKLPWTYALPWNKKK